MGKNYELYERKETKLNEEAHFLSLILYRLNYSNQEGNRYIKRMWTAFQYDNIEKTDIGFPIWHLPAEKKFGLERLYHKFIHNEKIDGENLLLIADRILMLSYPHSIRKLKRGYQSAIAKVRFRKST